MFTSMDIKAINVSQVPPQFYQGIEVYEAFRYIDGDKESKLKAQHAAALYQERGGDREVQKRHQAYFVKRRQALGAF